MDAQRGVKYTRTPFEVYDDRYKSVIGAIRSTLGEPLERTLSTLESEMSRHYLHEPVRSEVVGISVPNGHITRIRLAQDTGNTGKLALDLYVIDEIWALVNTSYIRGTLGAIVDLYHNAEAHPRPAETLPVEVSSPAEELDSRLEALEKDSLGRTAEIRELLVRHEELFRAAKTYDQVVVLADMLRKTLAELTIELQKRLVGEKPTAEAAVAEDSRMGDKLRK